MRISGLYPARSHSQLRILHPGIVTARRLQPGIIDELEAVQRLNQFTERHELGHCAGERGSIGAIRRENRCYRWTDQAVVALGTQPGGAANSRAVVFHSRKVAT